MNSSSDPAAPARFDSLIVPLDFSATADRILPIVGRLAQRGGLTVQLVTTASPGLEEYDLADLSARTQRVHGCPVTPVVIEGDKAAADLAAYVRSQSSALVCIASHGRTPIGELLLGSMTEELVRRHVGPMLAIGPAVADDYELGGTLLVGIDAETVRTSLLDVSLAWQTTFGGTIELTEAVTRDSPEVPLDPTPALQAAQELVPHATVRVLESHDPVRAIGDAAMDSGSVIALAAHARGGLERLVRGSVTGELLHWASVPLLIVSA